MGESVESGAGRADGAHLESRALRLAFVCHCLTRGDHSAGRIGGAERAAAELLAALRGLGDVEVIPVIEAAETDRLRFVAFAVSALRRLWRMAEAGEIDAILFTSMPTAWIALMLAPVLRRRGVATAAICHGHDVTWALAPYQALVPHVFGALGAVMPVSHATGRECLVRGLDPRRLHVVRNGADLGRFAPSPPFEARRGILRTAFPEEAARLADDRFVLLSVGRQVRRKGHAWFVRHVMPRLDAGVELWLAGDGPEAPLIEAAAADAGVAGRVRRLGALDDGRLAALYQGADLFVMPNIPVPGDIEGFGLVLLEAALNGLPALAADIEGVAEVVAPGVSGLFAPAGDPDAFAEAVRQLRADPDALERLGGQAAVYARDGFGWDEVARRHADLLAALRLEAAAAPALRPDAAGALDLLPQVN